ncbi:MAG: DUF2867 domain-containing protein, partial [Propionibacteriales bacterium]|nr:DUF2867 domain-containing protein [Propionibacteriales bacterium]
HPRGIAGHLYWWLVFPFHGIVFGSMQRNMAQAAERLGGPPAGEVRTHGGPASRRGQP